MTFRDRVSSWFRPSAKLSTPDAAWSIAPQAFLGAGTHVTTDTALQISAVYGCVSRIANAIAPHPWEVHEVTARRREVRTDDPIAYLLSKRPNPSTTAVAFRQAMVRAAAAGDGNAYAEIQKDLSGRPTALWPLEPDRVVPHTENDGTIFYRVAQYSGGTVDVDASRIYHLRGLASANGLVGDSTVYRASMALAIAAAAQQYAAAYYVNGTISSGVLKHPKRMDQKSIDRLRKEWIENHSGPAAKHKPLFLEEGMEWASIAVDAEKSQLHETRAFQVEEIARYFGVPLHLLGVAQSAQGYGTNVSQLGLEFRRYTLEPWVAALQQEADLKLFPQRAPWRETRIDLCALTRGDGKAEAETLSILKKAGILSQNEAREDLGYNTVGAQGDVFTVESTMKTVEDLIDPPEPPAPKALPAANDPAAPKDPAAGIARDAAATLYAGALLRHVKRVEKANGMPRDRSLAKLEQECLDASPFIAAAGLRAPNGSLAEFAAYVEQGEPPPDAARRLLSSLERP